LHVFDGVYSGWDHGLAVVGLLIVIHEVSSVTDDLEKTLLVACKQL
jgi:hypothetical protein